MNYKKLISTILLSTTILLSACSGNNNNASSGSSGTSGNSSNTATSSDTLVFAVTGDPKVINPLYGDDRVTLTIMNAIYSPFYVYDVNGSRYYLAESFKASEDYKTFTLKLKTDLKWSDGEPITADDVIFTLDSNLDESQNSMVAYNLKIGDKNVNYKKVDDLTVEFTTDEPYIAFESNFENIRPIPKHIFEGEKDIKTSSKNEKPVSSGPYVLESAVSGDSVTLVKNENYSLGTANINKIVYKVLPDFTARKNALKTGEINVASITANDVSEIKDTVNLTTFEEGRLIYMLFKENNETLANKNVRKALSYAIDKDELIKGAYKSEEYAKKAYSFIANDTLYQDNSSIEKYDYNVEKAKELLKNENITGLKLRLAFSNADQVQKALATIIQQKYKEIGVEVELLPLDSGAFIEKLFDPNTKDFDMALNGYIMGKDPSSYSALFMSNSENNYVNYSNSALDELFVKGDSLTDSKEREENYSEIQKIIADDAVIYPISYPQAIAATTKNVEGIEDAKTVPIYMFEDLSKLSLK